MPHPTFDRSALRLLPLAQREHDMTIDDMIDPAQARAASDDPGIPIVAQRIRQARERGAAVVWMMGAHIIKNGLSPLIIDLMKRGFISQISLNGAGSIHDYELSLIGASTESVAKYISQGQFGLWQETGAVNDAAREAAAEGIGLGEAIGRRIVRDGNPYAHHSLLANAYQLGIPATVHVCLGCDIVHEHPNCDGAALGAASYTDFLVYAQTLTRLEGGVFLNLGSAVVGPEVYLKALSMVRNVAHQRGERITDFTTAVFDLVPGEGLDTHSAPAKSDPRYYFRPWKTILARTVADGGQSYYIQEDHIRSVSTLYRLLVD